MNNIQNIKLLLKSQCKTCNVTRKYENGMNCSDCNFTCDSFTRIIFKNVGISKPLYKHHLYYFIYHPELNFTMPNLPDYDYLFNNINDYTKAGWKWVIHHKDGNHWNDDRLNLLLILETEHHHIHWSLNNPSSDPQIVKRRGEEISKTQRKKIKEGTYWILKNNPMKNKKVVKKSVETRRLLYQKQILEGIHPFQVKNPRINYETIDRIKKWLKKLPYNETVQITKFLADKFEYCSTADFRVGLQNLLKRENFINFKINHNGLRSRASKWFLIKEEIINEG